MNKTMDLVTSTTLQGILTGCQRLQALLQQDQTALAQQALGDVEASNHAKQQQLQVLQDLLHQLAPHTVTAGQQQHAPLLQALRDQITVCYKYLTTNSQVVYTNLEKLKTISEKISASMNKDAYVYDVKGTLKK